MRDIFQLAYSVTMSAKDKNEAEVSLYGEIINDVPNEYWKWSKEDKSAPDFKKAIDKAIEDGATKLRLRINSPGGVCTEAVAMRSILANAGFEEINIAIEGLCASAATTLATLPGAHVTIAEGSEYMIHNPWCMAIGNANEMEHTIERLRNIEQMSRGFYMTKTGQTEEQIKEWMDEEKWFTAEQAVEFGFADELLKAETETPAAACVSARAMATMKSLYKSVPEQIVEITEDVNNGTPVAGEPNVIDSQKEVEAMDMANISMEELMAGNPELMAQIQQNAVEAERARIDEIDALTIPGYEALAAEAKANGTSAMDFQKSLVAAMKQKGSDFMTARQGETKPSQEIAGGNPAEGMKNEDEMIQENAKQIAEYAKQFTGSTNGMF